jgi:hypothetical protein
MFRGCQVLAVRSAGERRFINNSAEPTAETTTFCAIRAESCGKPRARENI